MDGHFVPNISMGPTVTRDLRQTTSHVLDVHLMVADPDRWIDIYRDVGADWISVHAEATDHLERTMAAIRESGARAGVALNPSTSLETLPYVLQDGDYVVVMSVNPGFGGQRFLQRSTDKIAAARVLIDRCGLERVGVEVDGGVGPENAEACGRAGADLLVAGSSIYGAADPQEAARAIYAAALAGAEASGASPKDRVNKP